MNAERVTVDDGEVAVLVEGTGEQVLLVHGAVMAEALAPSSALLADRWRCARIHRRGFGESSRPANASTAADARDCLAVLDALGAPRAHVVGWSMGALVALETAATAPERTASLTLFEPPIMSVPAAGEMAALLGPVMEAWQAGDTDTALDRFMAAVWGPQWRRESDELIPGAVAAARRDAAATFEGDLVAATAWAPDPTLGAGLTCPVLTVGGAASGPFFAQGRRAVRDLLPQTRDVEVPGGNHSVPAVRAAEFAAIVSAFLTEPARVG
ncbi:alpha/beta hydrolase [Pseudonocardia xishanensis]|uniref:Alpha/beta fold hydrolase n=1 Tax=Pseudonocardia xishanensis TaxID=630995 RepID=A0ABP8S5X7_9PSEU